MTEEELRIHMLRVPGLAPATRGLNDDEKKIAKRVFNDLLPLWRVDLTSGIGLNDRPFTVPVFGPLQILTVGALSTYQLHVGPMYFVRGMQWDNGGRATLVHELTHVWQGEFGGGYVGNSLFHQAAAWWGTGDTGAAYVYAEGDPWESYNVEQQASIVEDWYLRGEKESDILYPYIRDALRNPFARRWKLGPFAPYHG